jgi:predicted XRE-type DNA-binding protein
MRINTKETFFKRINKHGPIPQHAPKLGKCWVWTGCKQSDGYGTVRFNLKNMVAHRLAYMLCVGSIDGTQILHKCDNPACCRPSHLFPGTHSDNMQDMWNKNRHTRPIGRRNNHAKLKESQVLEIRDRFSKGKISQTKLAKEFGITQANASAIIRGQTWKFI